MRLSLWLSCLLACVCPSEPTGPAGISSVAVAKDKKRFVLEPSGKPFVPWGFNYDHDSKGRLLEDYWETEWPTVEAHFSQMKKLGANVVRIHLQFGKFMDGPDRPNAASLALLGKLLRLAERERLYTFYVAGIHAQNGQRSAWARDIGRLMREDGDNPYYRWFTGGDRQVE